MKNFLFILKTIICGHCLKAHSWECFGSFNDTHPRPPGLRFAPCKGIRILESGIFSLFVKCGIREIQELCNPESLATESGTQLKESGVPLTIWIQNTSSTNKESEIQFFQSGIHGEDPESKTVLDSLAWSDTNMVHWHSFLLLEAMSDMYYSDAQNTLVEPKRWHPLYWFFWYNYADCQIQTVRY